MPSDLKLRPERRCGDRAVSGRVIRENLTSGEVLRGAAADLAEMKDEVEREEEAAIRD